jgi:3-oxoadipate enol-lactonase
VPRIDLSGITTHYQQVGEGPDVVLVHAFTSNLAVWMLTGIVETLAKDFRVTLYDLRGHGMTTVVPHGYTSSELAADFRRLHIALKLEPAFLVGHSYGGVIAMQAAREYPELVRGVILSDTYFPGLSHLEPDMSHSGPWTDLRQTFLKAGIDIGGTVDFPQLFTVVASLGDEQMQPVREALGAPGVRWLSQMHQLAKTTAGTEFFEESGFTAGAICEVSQPVIAMYDEHSPFKATAHFLEQRLPNCTIETVPGAKHLAPVQNPKVFGELVQSHLRRLTGIGSASNV